MKTANPASLDGGPHVPALAGPVIDRAFWRRLLLGMVVSTVALPLLVWAIDVEKAQAGFATLASRPVALGAFVVLYSACFWMRAVAWSTLAGTSPDREKDQGARGLSSWKAFRVLQLALCLTCCLSKRAISRGLSWPLATE